MSDTHGCCAHSTVKYLTEEVPNSNGALTGYWQCSDCPTKFWPIVAETSAPVFQEPPLNADVAQVPNSLAASADTGKEHSVCNRERAGLGELSSALSNGVASGQAGAGPRCPKCESGKLNFEKCILK